MALVLAATVAAAACSGDGTPDEATPTPRVTPFVGAPPPPTPTPRPVFTPNNPTPLPAERTAEVMALLLELEPDAVALATALEEIRVARDVRFIAPLIELVRARNSRVGYLDTSHVALLEELTGQRYARDWDRWAAWYGRTTLEAPPGFVAWKGTLLGRIDPRFAEFLWDGAPVVVRPELVVWGTIPVDGITPLDHAPAVPAAAATYLVPNEPVYGVVVNGEARAYPMRILDAHEMANDTLGGVPIALAYCTLCASGIVYDRRTPDGTVLSFSTSGLLYESNKLMYDRQTRSLWNQFTGRPVVGPLVEAAAGTSGSWLRVVPSVIATWESWQAAHPQTTVLALETGVGEGYTLGYPYVLYFTNGDLQYPVSRRSTEMIAKVRVFGVVAGDEVTVYGPRTLSRTPVINDRVGEVDVVVIANGPSIEVSTREPIAGELTYLAGREVRAFERPAGLNFSTTPDATTVLDHRGRAWTITEEALIGPDGERAPRLVGHTAYWFAWYAFHPDARVYEAP